MIEILLGTNRFPVHTLIDLKPGAVRNRLAKAMAAEQHGFGLIDRDGMPVDLTLDTLARLFTDREIGNALARGARFTAWCVERAAR
jgi:hypothetical protein